MRQVNNMNDFENKIIEKLLTKYQNSKLSKEGSERNIKIKIDVNDPIMKSYKSRDSYKYREQNDKTIRILESKGYINAYFSKENEFEYLVLNVDRVDELYNYHGIPNPRIENEKVISILNSYETNSFMKIFKDDVIKQINEKYTYPKIYFNDSKELMIILKIIDEILVLNDEVMKRDFSVRVLGDSKKFVLYENKIINIIKDYDPEAKDIEKEDILKSYNIVSNYSYTLIKNKLVFKLKNTIIDLNQLPYDFSMSNQMIKDLTIIKSDIKRIITVENLTTFYGLNEDALIIYLAGFHNSIKQQLLLKIYEMYPNAEYYHFSDIDAGGFWIYNNLKNKTCIPFKPFRMGIKELENNKDNLKELTANDVRRLKILLTNPGFEEFYDVIKYMLNNNCKLEQEILD